MGFLGLLGWVFYWQPCLLLAQEFLLGDAEVLQARALPPPLGRRLLALLHHLNRRPVWCGSMTFWYGFETADPYLWLMDPDSNPVFVSVTFKTSIKNYFFSLSFFSFYFLKIHIHNCSKITSHKEVTKQYVSMFFLLFLLGDRRIQIWIYISD